MENSGLYVGKKVILYARQSSGRDDKSASTEVQVEEMTEYCKREGMVIIHAPFIDNNTRCEVYEDTPIGRATAKHDAAFKAWQKQQRTKRTAQKFRKDLGKALALSKEADYLMVYDDTRLYRKISGSSLVDHINNILRENECTIFDFSRKQVRDFASRDENLFHEIEELILQRDLEHKRERSLLGVDNRKRQRRTVSKAWGVIRKAGDCNIYFDPEIALVIKYVFESYCQNKSMGHILYEMNSKYQKHLITYKRKNEVLKARRYYITNVQNILKNPTYCGLMLFHGRYVRAQNVPMPIITESMFYRVQRKLADSRKSRVKTVIDGMKIERNTYPFSGLMYCGHCGGKMVISLDRGNFYYICRNSFETRNKQCAESRIRVNDFNGLSCLESSIQNLFLISLIEQQKRAYLLLNSDDDFNDLQREISSLEETKKDIITAREENLISSSEFLTRLRRINAELNTRITELQSLQSQKREDIDSVINEGYEALLNRTVSNSMYFDFLHGTVDIITVYSDRISIILKDGNSFELPRLEARTMIRKRGGSCKVLPRGTAVYNFRREYQGDSLLNYAKESAISYYCSSHAENEHELIRTDKYVISIYD